MFDEIAFYKDALSAAAIQGHYAAFVAEGHSLESALNTTNLVWTTGGNAPWIPQTTVSHDGVAAVRNMTIADSQESLLQTTVQGPGTVAFWWKISSEGEADKLEFYRGTTLLGTATVTGTRWSFATPTLADGSTHTYTAVVTDAAGNEGVPSSSFTLTVDTTAPTERGI